MQSTQLLLPPLLQWLPIPPPFSFWFLPLLLRMGPDGRRVPHTRQGVI